MYPRLKSWAFPRKGFRPTTRHLVGGLHAQRSAEANCSVRSGVLSPGFIRRGAGPWRGTFATATRRGDRLAHTILRTRSVLICSKIVERFSNALILGRLPARHRHAPWRERHGVIRPRVWGRPTAAPAPAPFWLQCSIMRHALTQRKRTDSKPPAGKSAMAPSASDALPPTHKRLGFRATQL